MARQNDLGADKTRGGTEEGSDPWRASAGGRLFLHLQQQLWRFGSFRKIGAGHCSTGLNSKNQRASDKPLEPREEGGSGKKQEGIPPRHPKDGNRSKRGSDVASESAGEIERGKSGGCWGVVFGEGRRARRNRGGEGAGKD